MQERQIVKTAYLPLKTRLIALLVYALVLFISKGLITANWSISGGGPDIWFFSAFGLLCFSLLTAPFFRPPRDSLANVTAVALLLGTLDLPVEINLYTELNVFRWLSFSIALIGYFDEFHGSGALFDCYEVGRHLVHQPRW